jgi:hypothetical protein
LEERWKIFFKVQNGLKLSGREDYSLVGHIDEEWHSDEGAPGYVYIYHRRKEVEDRISFGSDCPKVLLRFGKLYLFGTPSTADED